MITQEKVYIRQIAIKDYLTETLLNFHKSRLEGNDFDFFFVLSTDLDEVKQKLKETNEKG